MGVSGADLVDFGLNIVEIIALVVLTVLYTRNLTKVQTQLTVLEMRIRALEDPPG